MISLSALRFELKKIQIEKLSSTLTVIFRKKSKLETGMFGEIMEKLTVWEDNNGYLDNKVTLHILSKRLNTNSSYLSKAINSVKEQNFSSYLKGLRISHAINELRTNPEIIQSKSMIQIAEMYGFNSTNVFTQAFKEKIGVTPGVFFKRISA